MCLACVGVVMKNTSLTFVFKCLSFCSIKRCICIGLDKSRRCSLKWETWKGQTANQFTVSMIMAMVKFSFTYKFRSDSDNREVVATSLSKSSPYKFLVVASR